jgi:hypothetical protein
MLCGAAAAHDTAARPGSIETSLKVAANEVFALLNAAHEQVINTTSRRQVCAGAALLLGWGVAVHGCKLLCIAQTCGCLDLLAAP